MAAAEPQDAAGVKTLRVELVTPEGPVYADEARMVIVPGEAGELGVLPRHMPLTARLKPGETRVQKSPDQWAAFATSEGFFSISADTASVLVEAAVAAETIDISAVEAELAAAQEALSQAEADGNEGAQRNARRDIAYAEARLEVGRAH